MHAPDAQHPFVQPAGSHTHCPLTQWSPAPQGSFAPHLQPPFAHESAFTASHITHALPPLPHAAGPGVTHWPLALQQPEGHVAELHTHDVPLHS